MADTQDKSVRSLKALYIPAIGLDPQTGVMRRDPSDIIKVGDLYYVWYSKGKIAPGYDATVWYATSPDGHAWTEKGMALAKGEPGSWEGASVFTPNILVAEERWLHLAAPPISNSNSSPQKLFRLTILSHRRRLPMMLSRHSIGW